MLQGQDVIVVGAGIIGAAIALALARSGARVRVVDAGLGGATGAAFGWINASFHLGPAHFALRQAGISAWHRLAAETPVPVNFCGALCWEEQGTALTAQGQALEALGYPVQRVTRAQIAAMEPAVADPPEEALLFEGEGVAEPVETTRALLSDAARHGARMLRGLKVTALLRTGGRITGVRTAAGDLTGDHVVVAAGCAAPELLEPLGIALPMVPRPAVVVETLPVGARITRVLVAPQGEIRQLPGGGLVMPASAGHQADDAESLPGDPLDIAAATLDRLSRLIGEPVTLAQAQVAWRPVPRDGLPVIGAAAEGLHVAVMHSGITLAAIAAEIVDAEISGQPPREAVDLAPFRPDRFAARA